jgi:CheY-like chemotaxis protein
MSSIDRRRYPRFPADDPVRYCTLGTVAGSETRVEEGNISNYSDGGIFIETALPVSLSELLVLNFHFRTREPLKLLGRAVWSGEREGRKGMGISIFEPNNRRVLIAEDNIELASLIAAAMRREGMMALPVREGREAWQLIQYDLPKVVVLDYKLPGMNGLDICRKIKEIPWTKNAHVLMITAYTHEQEEILSASPPPDELMLKPFKAGQLISRIKALLAGPPAKASQSQGASG